MRIWMLILTLIGFLEGNTQQKFWTVRLGAIGTGTFDEGLWYFREEVALGPQKFIFSNSWGIGVDADINYHPRFKTGIHLAASHMGLALEVVENGSLNTTSDHLAVVFALLEQRYQWRPERKFQPTLGISAGWMLVSDLNLEFRNAEYDFKFQDPFVFGAVFGFNYVLNDTWSVHTLIRALTFHFTTEPTSITHRQMLLDQVWWMNYNHIQVGIGKNF